MGGFFGVTSKRECVLDLFFGVDYHSHLGTRRAGMAVHDEENGFYPMKETIPFEVSKPILGLDKVQIEQYSIMIQTNQPVITIKDSSQAEARITLNIRMFIYDMKKQEILTDLKIAPIKAEVLEKLPGFVIYYVKQGDSLWQIGKRYYVSVDKIKEINNLTSEEIKAGDRLLIVK